MKQLNRSVAIILICALMLMLAACEQTKSYATLEEWYADNPLPESIAHTTLKAEGLSGKIDITIEGNEVISKCTLSKKVFGEDEKMDELYIKVINNAISKEKTNMNEIINTFSVQSGIDASQISLRYEFYNPGDPTPSYSQSFEKNFF